MNTLTRSIIFYVISFLVGTGLFILLFHTSLAVSLVLFYRGIVVLVVSCLVSLISLLVLRRSRIKKWYEYDSRDIALSIVLLFCVNLVFFTHVPVTADRSISLFLLGYMNAHQSSALTRQQLADALTHTYLGSQDAVQKRIGEQLQSKTIGTKNGGYTISPVGMWLIRFFGFISDLFGIKKTNLSL